MESKESRAPYKEKFWETRLTGDSRGEFEILTLASWFSHYSYSRTSIRSSMGGWLGKYSMLSKVLRSKKKEKKRERKRKMKKKENRKEKEKKKREE